ncbi:MAG: hypothetical protein JSW53_01365 [Candidatus Bathyarchaeota archaeon]|nr:MAG: hypothetical protein JSW53_01365 [Candidatus Bathyarchaeota archaeon]
MTARPRRRARHDIIMEILKTAKASGKKKTQIMYKARLSYSQLEEYLGALKKAGFMNEEADLWKTTEKGLHVIEACDICLRLTRDV